MLVLDAGETRELATATGTAMRVNYTVVAGGGRLVGDAIPMEPFRAFRRGLARQRRAEVYDWIVDRLTQAVRDGQLTVQEAQTLRDEAQEGDLSNFPAWVRDRIEAYLGRPLPTVAFDWNATRAILGVSGVTRDVDYDLLLRVEVRAGAQGLTLDDIGVEVQA